MLFWEMNCQVRRPGRAGLFGTLVALRLRVADTQSAHLATLRE